MREISLQDLTIEIYENADEMPAYKKSQMEYYILMDANIPPNMEGIVSKTAGLAVAVKDNDKKAFNEELANLRMSFIGAIEKIDYKSFQFACMIYKIDGEKIDDLSETNLEKIISKVEKAGLSSEHVFTEIELLKKSYHDLLA